MTEQVIPDEAVEAADGSNESVCGETTDHDQRLTHEDDDCESWVCDRCGAEWWQDKPG